MGKEEGLIQRLREEYKEVDQYYQEKNNKGDHLLLMLVNNGLMVFMLYFPFWLIGKMVMLTIRLTKKIFAPKNRLM
ncbi:hypothetical protein [Aquibacillus kalidii]|uniref:hypothetical protein n=1 Tax=Aquibacillus kalidii TaxID=2762597 RepID=UPI0016489E4D|nr:hypothetical protein [Aquibacillus kalidii]